MTDPFTPERLMDAVAQQARIERTIEDAATVLEGRGYHDLAQRLRAGWQAYADPDGGVVYALPPEPDPTTTTLQIVKNHVKVDGYKDPIYRWVLRGSAIPMTWSGLLYLAGPEGVRVVKDGER